MGLGPAYRSLKTFGQADDLVFEFATHSIATPGPPSLTQRGGVYRDLRLVPYESAWRLESHDLCPGEAITARDVCDLNRPLVHTTPKIHPSTAATSRSSGVSGGLKYLPREPVWSARRSHTAMAYEASPFLCHQLSQDRISAMTVGIW